MLQRLARNAPEFLALEPCCPALIIRSLRAPTPQISRCRFEGRRRARRRPSRKGADATYADHSPTSSSVGATFSAAPPKSSQAVAMLRQQVRTVRNRFSDVSHPSPNVPQPRPIVFHVMLQRSTRAPPRNSRHGPPGARTSARDPRPAPSPESAPREHQPFHQPSFAGSKPPKPDFGRLKT